MRDMWLIQEVK